MRKVIIPVILTIGGIALFLWLIMNAPRLLSPGAYITDEERAREVVSQAVTPTGITNPAIIAAGNYHSAVIDSSGTLWMWGDGEYGRLGTGNTRLRRIPIKIMEDIAMVSAGADHTIALGKDGTVWAWGRSRYGQSGGLPIGSVNKPSQIMDGAVYIAAGRDHNAVIKTDGSLWTWGSNNSSQLGDGSNASTNTPEKIMDDVISVACGGSHTVVLKSDGSVWAWGANSYGQLGNGTQEASPSPVWVMDNVVSISARASKTLAIKNDGTLWTWGSVGNIFGDEESDSQTQQVPVMLMDNVASITAGPNTSFAIKKDGSLWGWGANSYSQLGDGTQEASPQPKKIMDGIASIAAGERHTLAITTGGNIIAWGTNVEGQLGNASEDKFEGGLFSVLGDFMTMVWTITEASILGVFIVYALISQVLPDFMVASDSNSGVHNFIVVVIWLALYVTLSILYVKFLGKRKRSMRENAYEKYEVDIFPMWHFVLYAISALIIPVRNYFELPGAFLLLFIPLVGIPQIHLMIIASFVNYPRFLIRQIFMVLMYAFAFFLFSVVAVIVFMVVMFALILGGAAGAVTAKVHTCAQCGASYEGSRCSCGSRKVLKE